MGRQGQLHTDPTLQSYLKRIGKKELLTREQEVELAKRIADGDDDARKTLAEHNLRLVVDVAKKFTYATDIPLIDLIQEGSIGLMTATKKFDHKRGFKFSTYATPWIWQAVQRSIANTGSIIRKPVHFHDLQVKMRKIISQFQTESNRDPSIEELYALFPGKAKKQIQMAYNDIADNNLKPASLNAPLSRIGRQDEGELGDVIPLESIPLDELCERKIMMRHLNLELGKLNERQRQVLCLRYGLEDGQQRTLHEVSKVFGLTRERIRQIEAQAIKVLKNSGLFQELYKTIL